MLSSSERELFSWTYLLDMAPQRKDILISLAWNKILKIGDILFGVIQTEVQCRKCYFNFLPQEAGAFGNNIEKEPQKLHPKLKEYVYCIFTENIRSACCLTQVVVFCKNIIIL